MGDDSIFVNTIAILFILLLITTAHMLRRAIKKGEIFLPVPMGIPHPPFEIVKKSENPRKFWIYTISYLIGAVIILICLLLIILDGFGIFRPFR